MHIYSELSKRERTAAQSWVNDVPGSALSIERGMMIGHTPMPCRINACPQKCFLITFLVRNTKSVHASFTITVADMEASY